MAAIIFLILTTLFALVSPQDEWTRRSCYDTNYTSGSPYETYLNTLLPSLSSNIGNYGFSAASVGDVNAIVLCRGDRQPDACRSCVSNVANETPQLCPNARRVVVWSEYCMLRYSYEPMLEIMANAPNTTLWSEINITSSSPDKYKQDLGMLMDDLRGKAANGGSQLKAAAGNRSGPDNQTIYALLQCTPDLSNENCDSCLIQAAQSLPAWYPIGARAYMPSCIIRYENWSFYNITRLQELQPGEDNHKTRNIIIIVSVVSCLILVCIGIFAGKRIKHKSNKDPETLLGEAVDDETISIESIQYDFGQIRAATNDFSDANKLGEGGFGVVYRGKLVNGKEIAVKRLSMNSNQGDVEFKNEVLLVAKLQHRNLVRLLGFSVQGTERLLVYEFVQNGSLDHFIFDPIRASTLDWDKRSKIIWGIARGLVYLHEDSMLRIIHRDLKASNVLLDEKMNPKIADFGMARLIDQDQTQERTNRIVGTYGYMAPEYASHGQFSVKSDVFSFGVLVLELISGKGKTVLLSGGNSEYLVNYAWRNWHEGTPANVIDPVMRRPATSGAQLDILRCVHIALLCVQENAADRPTMSSVVLMLSNFSLTLPVPSQPAFYLPNSRERESSASSNSRSGQSASNNDVSITQLFPR